MASERVMTEEDPAVESEREMTMEEMFVEYLVKSNTGTKWFIHVSTEENSGGVRVLDKIDVAWVVEIEDDDGAKMTTVNRVPLDTMTASAFLSLNIGLQGIIRRPVSVVFTEGDLTEMNRRQLSVVNAAIRVFAVESGLKDKETGKTVEWGVQVSYGDDILSFAITRK